MRMMSLQVLGDSAIRLSWGRSAVASRPMAHLRQMPSPLAYPTGAFANLQPAAAAAAYAPFGYGLGQPAGLGSSIYQVQMRVLEAALLCIL